jgi:hypothetical protein
MPDTVDDFMSRFGGGGSGTVDDRDANHYYDRFVSTKPDDREFDNNALHQGASEYLGKLPDDQFHDAARTASAQAPPQERQGLLSGLLGALGGGGGGGGGMGGGLGALAGMLGLGSTDPRQMSDDDAARLMNYARRERPEAMQQVVQDKPWFVKAMGNPIVMGALAMAATKLLGGRGGNRGGGLFG